MKNSEKNIFHGCHIPFVGEDSTLTVYKLLCALEHYAIESYF